MTWDIKAGVMGKTQRVAAEYILSHFPSVTEHMSVDEYIDLGNARREELWGKVEPMRGATALVKGLHAAGIPIALATGSSLANLKLKTAHLPEIFTLFPDTSILTADSPEVKPGRGKPFPDIFLAAAHSLGRDVGTAESCTPAQKAERERGIVFEDARPGVLAGVAAGMNVMWVPDPELLALAPGEKYGAKRVLSHLEGWDPTEWGLPPLPGFNDRAQ
ncbi:hypothetical protein CI109_102440 [Kwoniella shandongensis]|uniref:Uncharacterized protein n=1 Tax=Kwoniella shandongensis TaxID=1734106 RepID=A0A5M6C399_9TREE|nr:uncharacterized protein CI109_003241 [Kwoniella shandongensis]KAA5528342.1 hypothetical protein CI109_003241 [Kwoniella shandongensis]